MLSLNEVTFWKQKTFIGWIVKNMFSFADTTECKVYAYWKVMLRGISKIELENIFMINLLCYIRHEILLEDPNLFEKLAKISLLYNYS